MTANAPAAFTAPPPHMVAENAFGADVVERLLAFAMTREAEFSDTRIGKQAKLDKAIRSSRVCGDFGPLQQELEGHFTGKMAAAVSVLGLSAFELEGLSMELVAHGDGDFYHRHIDTFVGTERSDTERVLTGVYYFHGRPKAFEGGELRLFSPLPPEEGGSYVDIAPLNDRLVLFPAWVPHAVRRTSCPGGGFAQSRFAINCWYRRRRS